MLFAGFRIALLARVAIEIFYVSNLKYIFSFVCLMQLYLPD